jgi:predicted permease
MATEANLAAGMAPEEARYAALREFGNVASIQQQSREERGGMWLEQWTKDLLFAARALMRARGFSLAVWLSLVTGIGVATVVFTLTAHTLIAPPYPDYDRLYLIGVKHKQNPLSPARFGVHFEAYQEQTNAFSAFAAASPNLRNVVINDAPVLTNMQGVSADCFQVLGVKPALGREFLPEEHRAGAGQVIVLSDLFWRRHFAASPAVLGRQVTIDEQPYTVIGVLAPAQPFPPGFGGEVFRPLQYKLDPANPLSPIFHVIGKLRPDIDPESARRQLAGVTLPTTLPVWAVAHFAEQEVVLTKPTELARPETLWVMLGAVALLYGIACLNAMNLMLVRLLGRQQELGIRFALGGTHWRIARLLLMEGTLLALAAGGTILLAAGGWFPALFSALTGDEALRYASNWNARTLGCITGLTVLAAGLMGAVPVWRLLQAEISPSLKDGGRAFAGSRRITALRTTLVVLQAALAVVLLAGTGLLVRSLDRLRQVDLGFNPTGKVKVGIATPPGYVLPPQKRFQLFESLQQRLVVLPGVKGASMGQDALLVGRFWDTAQLKMADGSYQPIAGSFVAENLLKVAGLHLKSGRWISDKRGPIEVVINETLARNRFGQDDPIGKSIYLKVSNSPHLVVGVVKDVKEDNRRPAGMRIYVANWVYPPNLSMVLLRMDEDPGPEFAGLVRKVVYDFDPKLITYQVTTLNETVDQSLRAERNMFIVLRALSGIALFLAVLGLFSVIAFTVQSRTREFGVRLALGATPGNLQRLVLWRGVLTVAGGVLLGSAAAMGLTQFMRSLLFETSAYEPVVYLGVAGILLLAAILAGWLPARRAAKVDPMIALRSE